MKKIITLGFCLLSLCLLVVSSSPKLFKAIYTILPNPDSNGDLYRMCDLKEFKQHKEYPLPVYSRPSMKDINLYILGDSYTDYMDSSYFNVNYYHFINWNYPPWKISGLNLQKKNIVIIETTERHLRDRFKQPATKRILIDNDYTPSKDKSLKPHLATIKAEENLDYFLTYNQLSCSIKELKAFINLSVFNRIDDAVSLSKDKKHIFLKETTAADSITSSFYPMSDSQLDSVIENINITYHHFISLGFTNVYLSVIPNEVSLMAPNDGNYNHLIERLSASSNLEMPVIDMYRLYKNSPDEYYYKSDTHWNKNGYMAWLQKVDSVSYNISAKL